jgi:hypothetical protein
VTASREVNGEVVNLVYAIDSGPQTTIEVSGVNVDNAVLQRLRDAWATSILDELLIEEATQILRNDLALRGYVRPVVSAHVTSEGNVRTLRIDVQPGERSGSRACASSCPTRRSPWNWTGMLRIVTWRH